MIISIERQQQIDIIILSYAHSVELQQVTIACINSLMISEDPLSIKFNVVVIESEMALDNYQYPFSRTIYPSQPFGFHRYMNLGVSLTNAPYVCLCNNDLLFHKGWASEILNYMYKISGLVSASPICSIYHAEIGISTFSGVRIGYNVGVEIAGWCLFIKREALDTMGELDENFAFNAADLDYSTTLEALGLKHGLITSSIVDHLRSKTLNTQSDEKQDELNLGKKYYDQKWNYRLCLR